VSSILFAGGAGEVTGSRHLLRLPQGNVLLDCGLFQGRREEARKKSERFLFDPAQVDAVILSHAHIDHCGALPLLLRRGFQGRIYCSPATAELARLLLVDSARIQEHDARFWAKRHGKRDFEPLYTEEEVETCLDRFSPQPYALDFEVLPGVKVCLHEAGHILGSAQVSMRWREGGRERKLYFTGDLGQPGAPLLRDPYIHRHEVDVLLMESTYGDREHEGRGNLAGQLLTALEATLASGGRVLIPAFAVGRTQEIIYVLADLFESGRLSRVPVFVDSPLAAATTRLFRRHRELMDTDYQAEWSRRDPFGQPFVAFVENKEESQALNERPGPCIILAASGMCEAGRVLHHLMRVLPQPKDLLLFTGFQAQGTLGRRLKEGASEAKIFGTTYPVRCRVLSVEGFSAHADRGQLLAWAAALTQAPGKVWLVHGESTSASNLAVALRQKGWEAEVPLYGKEVEF
jgi:metallo-beta-lactamase family protein